MTLTSDYQTEKEYENEKLADAVTETRFISVNALL